MRLPSWLRFWRPAPSRVPSPRPRRSRPCLEHLEDRFLPTAYTAASVAQLIYDINDANLHPGTNTITLAAATTFTLTAVNNTALENLSYATNGLPVIAAG